MARLSSAFLLCAVCVSASAARAFEARDVMEKMSKEERFGYVTGLADMLSYQYVLAGDRTHAECITDAFYSEKKEETWKRVYEAFGKLPAKAPEGLIVGLMKQTCGK